MGVARTRAISAVESGSRLRNGSMAVVDAAAMTTRAVRIESAKLLISMRPIDKVP